MFFNKIQAFVEQNSTFILNDFESCENQFSIDKISLTLLVLISYLS